MNPMRLGSGYRTHLLGAALALKGVVALTTGHTADGAVAGPLTFDNLETRIEVASHGEGKGTTRDRALTDLLLGGGLAALRSGIRKEVGR